MAAANFLSVRCRVRGQRGVLVKMGLRVVSLTAVHPARMIILPGSVYHRVKSLFVRVVADDPEATTWILHGIFPRHAVPYGKEYSMKGKKKEFLMLEMVVDSRNWK